MKTYFRYSFLAGLLSLSLISACNPFQQEEQRMQIEGLEIELQTQFLQNRVQKELLQKTSLQIDSLQNLLEACRNTSER